mmetsp:Transcript_2115/g.4862  ORF Transcript_2115/g.4862 Transcript_2115/m.4862 type:complete len:203 (+) Transcript_2115:1277-1885(+)
MYRKSFPDLLIGIFSVQRLKVPVMYTFLPPPSHLKTMGTLSSLSRSSSISSTSSSEISAPPALVPAFATGVILGSWSAPCCCSCCPSSTCCCSSPCVVTPRFTPAPLSLLSYMFTSEPTPRPERPRAGLDCFAIGAPVRTPFPLPPLTLLFTFVLGLLFTFRMFALLEALLMVLFALLALAEGVEPWKAGAAGSPGVRRPGS